MKMDYMRRFAEEFPMEPQVPYKRLHLVIDGCEIMDLDSSGSLRLFAGLKNNPSIIQVSLPRYKHNFQHALLAFFFGIK